MGGRGDAGELRQGPPNSEATNHPVPSILEGPTWELQWFLSRRGKREIGKPMGERAKVTSLYRPQPTTCHPLPQSLAVLEKWSRDSARPPFRAMTLTSTTVYQALTTMPALSRANYFYPFFQVIFIVSNYVCICVSVCLYVCLCVCLYPCLYVYVCI